MAQVANPFLPRAKVWLSSQPFDPSNENKLYFDNAGDKFNHFINGALQVPSTDNIGDSLSWANRNGTIKLRISYNTALAYNYMVIREYEASNDHKDFYCYIVGIEYDNPNTTIFMVQTDVFTTWMHDITFKPCLVERETVASDELFEHLLPEKISTGSYEVYSQEIGHVALGAKSATELNENYYVCFTTCGSNSPNVPRIHDTDIANIDPPPTYIGGNLNCGCYFWAWSRVSDAAYDISWYSGAGNVGNAFIIPPEEVVGIFLVPKPHGDEAGTNDFLEHGSDYSDGRIFTLKSKGERPMAFTTNPTTSAFGYQSGFTPHNNKLYSYPYCYTSLALTTTGEERVFKNEMCPRDDEGQPLISISSCFTLNAIPSLAMWCNEYNGEHDSYSNAVVFNQFPSIPYACDGFQQYWAQHKSAIMTGWGASLLGIGGSAMSSVGSYRSSVEGAQETARLAQGVSKAFAGRQAAMTAGAATSAGASLAFGLGALGLNAVGTIAKAMGEYNDLTNIPDQRHGEMSDGIVQQIEDNPFRFRHYHLKLEELKRIDEFFDCYGYYINQIKTPTFHNRSKWDYIKTSGCLVTGNIPLQDRLEIQTMFDNGVRLWYNASDFMDFNLSSADSPNPPRT